MWLAVQKVSQRLDTTKVVQMAVPKGGRWAARKVDKLVGSLDDWRVDEKVGQWGVLRALLSATEKADRWAESKADLTVDQMVDLMERSLVVVKAGHLVDLTESKTAGLWAGQKASKTVLWLADGMVAH